MPNTNTIFDVPQLVASSPEWLQKVLQNFDEFLKDHADCERKASSMAMSLVAKYPQREAILNDLIHTAIEELEHFRLVFKLMQTRGVALHAKMEKDHYIEALQKNIRTDAEKGFLDRLVIGAIVENRGYERFKLIAENFPEPKIAQFYYMIYTSEEKHGNMFLALSDFYFEKSEIEKRYYEFAGIEAKILRELPIRAALH